MKSLFFFPFFVEKRKKVRGWRRCGERGRGGRSESSFTKFSWGITLSWCFQELIHLGNSFIVAHIQRFVGLWWREGWNYPFQKSLSFLFLLLFFNNDGIAVFSVKTFYVSYSKGFSLHNWIIHENFCYFS